MDHYGNVCRLMGKSSNGPKMCCVWDSPVKVGHVADDRWHGCRDEQNDHGEEDARQLVLVHHDPDLRAPGIGDREVVEAGQGNQDGAEEAVAEDDQGEEQPEGRLLGQLSIGPLVGREDEREEAVLQRRDHQLLLAEEQRDPVEDGESHQDKEGEAVQHGDQDQPGQHPEQEEPDEGHEGHKLVGLLLDRLDRDGGAEEDADDGDDGRDQAEPAEVDAHAVRVHRSHLRWAFGFVKKKLLSALELV